MVTGAVVHHYGLPESARSYGGLTTIPLVTAGGALFVTGTAMGIWGAATYSSSKDAATRD